MDHSETKKRIALLVDYDNFNETEYFNILFDELSGMGEIIIGRVYFSNEEGKKLSNKFLELKLDPIYQLRFSKGKNAVDIRMSIDAIELLSKEYINAFCLATHDSDFTPLVKKLKEHNKYLIGAGRDNVSDYFKNACDSFINVEQISNAKKTQEEKTAPQLEILNKRLKKLIKLIDEIISQNNENDDFMYLSIVTSQIYVKDKEFNPKNYGAQNNKILPFFQNHLNSYYELKKEKNGWKIKISTNRPSNTTTKKKPTIQINHKMKAKAKQIIDDYYKTTDDKGNIQKIQQQIKKEIPKFTLKQIGHTKFINLIKEFNYTVEGNTFTKK